MKRKVNGLLLGDPNRKVDLTYIDEKVSLPNCGDKEGTL